MKRAACHTALLLPLNWYVKEGIKDESIAPVARVDWLAGLYYALDFRQCISLPFYTVALNDTTNRTPLYLLRTIQQLAVLRCAAEIYEMLPDIEGSRAPVLI